jgi:hypothetical protein
MMEVAMSSRADLDGDLAQLMADSTALADENDRLRRVNAEMLAALESALPILQDAAPPAVDLDWAKEVTAKVQAAIAAAEQDPWS